ncbi:MAG: FtsX-like permease family protein [Oscillospiraceae bacterium]|nr:FtsX-like permease family protein [Oscillospiraceae bacterium]
MWQKKVIHKKWQFLLIGVIFFVTAMMFSSCLGFVLETSEFAQTAINEENCPDAYILTVGSTGFSDNFPDASYEAEILNVTALAGKTITAPILYEDRDITMTFDMLLDGSNYRKWGYLELSQGDASTSGPQNGEVWISETVAVPSNIAVGDTIILDYPERLSLAVSGIYKTTCFPRALGYAPMLVSPDTLMFAEDGDDSALFAVNVRDYSNDKVKGLFEDSPFCVLAKTRDDVRMSLEEYSGTFGAIGIVAVVFIFLLTLIIINFIIYSNIMKEYRSIGIYKSLGYSLRKISRFYTTGYFVLGITFFTLGALASLIIIQALGNMSAVFVDRFSLSNASLISIIVTIIVLILLLIIVLTTVLRKIKVITPVEAISMGLVMTDKKMPDSVIKNAGTPASMAINEIFKYKKTTFLTALVIVVSMFLSMLFVMICNSSFKMLVNANLWFCLPKSDLYITGNINDTLIDDISKSQYVKTAVYGDFSYKSQIKVEGYESIIKYLRFDAYSELTESITGIRVLSGKAPTGSDEVMIGNGLSSLLGLRAGDSIKLTLNHVTKDYTITAVYATVADNGTKIIMTTDALRNSVPDYIYQRAFISLKNNDDFELFKDDIERKALGISVSKRWFAVETTVASVQAMLNSISILLTSLFILFSLLNIVIVVNMEHKNLRRTFGIMKSLGFTSRYIIKRDLVKYLIISSVSTVIALVLHLALSQNLMAAVFIDAFTNSSITLGMLTVGFVVLVLLFVLLLSQPVKKISPVELMEE